MRISREKALMWVKGRFLAKYLCTVGCGEQSEPHHQGSLLFNQ